MTAAEIISEIAHRLERAAPAGSRVLLFGSEARGDPTAGSDLDLLVIEPHVTNPASEAVRLRRALRGLPAPIDVLVVSADVAARRGKVAGTVVNRALREGQLLVDA